VSHRITLEANHSPLNTSPGTGRRVVVERPSRSNRRIETINEAESKPLDASPGDYCSIIGAQFWRRCDKAQPGIIGEACKTSS
jgi:hypothetical protein